MKSNNQNYVRDARINFWGAKKLSFAGRLQLPYLVLHKQKVYWSNILLPKKVIKLITQQFSRFYGVEVITHEVAWNSIYWQRVMEPRGLGCRRVADSNKAKWWGIHGMLLPNWGGLDKRKLCWDLSFWMLKKLIESILFLLP